MSSSPAQAPIQKKTANPVRVCVVDDSVVVRGLVARWLDEDMDISVVATFRNGREAVEGVVKADPDLMVLDIEMPEMDGLTALPLLLKAKPGLTVVMASTLTRRNAEFSMKAMQLGARDYVPKPEGHSGISTSADFRREIVEKVKALGSRMRDRRAARAGTAAAPAATASAQTNLQRLSTPERKAPSEAKFQLRQASSVTPRILAIGSSTGGPQALMTVLAKVGPLFQRMPVVVTQHMPAAFTPILAEHLARATNIKAAEAVHGEPLMAGRIYVAPGGKHLVFQKDADGVIALLSDAPPVNFCKPAVDPMFESLVAAYGAAILALVLTGMGSDGANGGRAIAAGGGTVIAQDEATSVVWGMPGATAMNGCCSAVLPLDQIAPKILSIASGVR